jgi:hypothetical protein
MASASSGTIAPTAAETSLAQIGADRFQDYTQRWEPLQMHLASQIEGMDQANSWQRQEAKGKAGAEVQTAFSQQENQVAGKQLTTGVNVGSQKFALGQTEMSTDQARDVGERENQGNDAVTRQYLAGLTSLTAIGRGQAATATQGMGVSTDIATRMATSDAMESAASRVGNEQLLGYGIGVAGAAMSQPGGMSGGQWNQSGATYDNSNGAFTPMGSPGYGGIPSYAQAGIQTGAQPGVPNSYTGPY